MPIITMPSRTVVINKKTNTIINIFNKNIENLDLKQLDSKFSGDPKLRLGLFYPILGKIEQIANKILGAKEIVLPEIKKDLDPAAKCLLEMYRDYLYKILKEQAITSDVIIQPQIKNHYILIVELVLRLLTEALSTTAEHSVDFLKELAKEFSPETRQSIYIKVLCDFTRQLAQNGVLESGSIFGRKISVLGQTFDSSEHENKWLNTFEKIIAATALVHANKTSVTTAMRLLEEVKVMANKHLIAELVGNSRIEESRFDERMLSVTIQRLEDKKLKSSENIDIHNRINLSDRQKGVIDTIDPKEKALLKPNITKRQAVQDLYIFLNKAHLLHSIFSQFSMLNTATGWVGIITGVIDIHRLVDMMDLFAAEVQRCLVIDDKQLKLISQTSTGVALHRAGAINPWHFKNEFRIVKQKVEVLSDKGLQDNLIKLIHGCVGEMSRLMQVWDLEYKQISGNQNKITKTENIGRNNVSIDSTLKEESDLDRAKTDSLQKLPLLEQAQRVVVENINNGSLNRGVAHSLQSTATESSYSSLSLQRKKLFGENINAQQTLFKPEQTDDIKIKKFLERLKRSVMLWNDGSVYGCLKALPTGINELRNELSVIPSDPEGIKNQFSIIFKILQEKMNTKNENESAKILYQEFYEKTVKKFPTFTESVPHKDNMLVLHN